MAFIGVGRQIDDGQKASPSGQYVVDMYTTVDRPPVAALRAAVDGRRGQAKQGSQSTMGGVPDTNIREFQSADEADVVAVWHRSGIATYTFLPTWQAFTLEEARSVFNPIIRPNSAIWVATLEERVVAYLAMKGTCIDRLYVDPPEWRKGWGTQLLNLAKQMSPHGLELYTHQENLVGARLL